jgi:hypothetical protein
VVAPVLFAESAPVIEGWHRAFLWIGRLTVVVLTAAAFANADERWDRQFVLFWKFLEDPGAKVERLLGCEGVVVLVKVIGRTDADELPVTEALRVLFRTRHEINLTSVWLNVP